MPPELRETPLESVHLPDEVVDFEAACDFRHVGPRAIGRSGTGGARSQKRRAERGGMKDGEYSTAPGEQVAAARVHRAIAPGAQRRGEHGALLDRKSVV